jgi:hypothetical protein
MTRRRRAFVPDGVVPFTCDCAIGREAGSSGEGDSGPYAKMLAWFAAGPAGKFALNASSQQPRRSLNAIRYTNRRCSRPTRGVVVGLSRPCRCLIRRAL